MTKVKVTSLKTSTETLEPSTADIHHAVISAMLVAKAIARVIQSRKQLAVVMTTGFGFPTVSPSLPES